MALTVFERFGRWLVKAAAPNLVLVPKWSRVPFMRPTFQQLASQGYKANGAVFSCISALAMSFPEPPLLVWEETEAGRVRLPDHNLTKLLQHPNEEMSTKLLLQYLMVYTAIGGTGYLYKQRSAAGRTVALWPVHAGQLVPIAGETSFIDHYEFDNGGGGAKQIIAETDVIRFPWLPDPLQPQTGLAPLVAAAREVDVDNEATSYLFALLKNDAMPRLAIEVPAERKPLEEGEFERLTEEWSDSHGGKRRGGVAVIEGGMKIQTIALNLKELEFGLLRRVPEARIASVLRVPPVVAGLVVGLEQMTYDNVKGMRLHFAESTLTPFWQALGDALTADLLPEFGPPGRKVVAFDIDKVAVLAERNEAKRSWALPALSAGGILVNEYRAVMGLPRDENGDVYLRGLAMVEAPARIAGQGKAKAAPGPSSRKAPAGEIRRVRNHVAAMRAVREAVASPMEKKLDAFFVDLAKRAVERAGKALKARKGGGLPDPEDLITGDDEEELTGLVKGFYITLLQETWPLINSELGVRLAFDLADPIVVGVLKTAAGRVKGINEATLETVRVLLQQGAERGWSIQHLVAGDPENGIPGLQDAIEETYKNRASTIARTELGTAQNTAATGRYRDAGVTDVIVMDGDRCGWLEHDDPDQAEGSIRTLEEAEANPLSHPNCVRAWGAYFTEES